MRIFLALLFAMLLLFGCVAEKNVEHTQAQQSDHSGEPDFSELEEELNSMDEEEDVGLNVNLE